MYPQCRHVRTNSDRCSAAAIKGSHWCFFHGRLHDQQLQRAERVTREVERRSKYARTRPRLADGTFAPREDASDRECIPAEPNSAELPEFIPLQLPAPEDSASIQLALIEVIQSLAAGQIKPRRAGLLLYGLQVASANAKNVSVHSDSIRSISFTKEGIPLATQEHGWDVEDIEEADRLAEEEEDE
jgi:hypothetical protein